MRVFRYAGLIGALSGIALMSAATGQSVNADTESTVPGFGERVNVQVVEVEAFVTDVDGKRVQGLRRQDFEIYEDGEPVEITNFYEVADARRSIAETTPAFDGDATAPERGSTPDADRRPLYLVLYVDNVNIEPLHRRRTLPQIGAMLEGMLPPGGRVMLVSYDRGLHVRQPFTDDVNQIRVGLDRLSKTTAWGAATAAARGETLSAIVDSESLTRALQLSRLAASETDNDLRSALGAQRELLENLAGLPGRKAILYVSDGLPMTSARDLFHAVDEAHGGTSALSQQLEFDNSVRFRELVAHANANGVTLYTVDAAGTRAGDAVSVDRRAATPSAVESVQRHNLQSSIRYMADETGGLAIVNRNRIESGLRQIRDDFRSYYSLGYRPRAATPGRYHRIEVKTKVKGLTVRHRQGYRGKSPAARMNDSVRAALRFQVEENPLGVELEFGPAKPRADDLAVLPMTVSIPLRHLVLVPAEELARADAQLYVATADSAGATSEIHQLSLPVLVPTEELEDLDTKTYEYTVSLLTGPGKVLVVVAVHDQVADRRSITRRTVLVGGGVRSGIGAAPRTSKRRVNPR